MISDVSSIPLIQCYIIIKRADCRTKRRKYSFSKGLLPPHTRRRVIESVLNDI